MSDPESAGQTEPVRSGNEAVGSRRSGISRSADGAQPQRPSRSQAGGIPEVAIIVPTLNEVDNIDPLLTGLSAAFCARSQEFEILVADGGSTDGTCAAVRLWEKALPVMLVECTSGAGLAGDVLEAARKSRAPTLLVMDADLSHSPGDAPLLAARVCAGHCDMAIGSRYVEGASVPGLSPWRRLVSRAGVLFAHPFTGARDPMSGFFAIQREHLLAVGRESRGFKIALEALMAGGEDLRVEEHPICFSNRHGGASKMGRRQTMTFLERLVELAGGVRAGLVGHVLLISGLLCFVLDLAARQLIDTVNPALVGGQLYSFGLASLISHGVFRHVAAREGAAATGGLWSGLRIVGLFLLALFARMSVASLLGSSPAVLPLVAEAGASLSAALVNCVGVLLFVHATPDRHSSVSTRWATFVASLVAYSAMLRLLLAGQVDLLPQEAYYWSYAQHPALGYLDHPPMVAWLISLGTWLLGDSELGVRIPALICWLIASAFLFKLARNLHGRETALRALLLMAALPYFFVVGFVMIPDTPLVACWAGALMFLERALLAGRRWGWVGAGLCVGLGMLSKYTIALLGPAALLFLVLDKRSRTWLKSPWPYLALALGLVLFSPVIIWNMQNDWASFAFQSTRRVQADSQFSLHILVIMVLVVLTPVGLIAAFAAMRRRGPASDEAMTGDPRRRAKTFSVLFTLVPLSVFFVFSLFHAPKLNWTGPLWLASLPIIARHMADYSPGRKRPLWPATWRVTSVVTMVLVAAMGCYLVNGLPGVRGRHEMKLPLAWGEMAQEVRGLADDLHSVQDCRTLVVGMDKYNIASELAFYLSGRNPGTLRVTGRNAVGRSSLMFSIWDPGALEWADKALLVGLRRKSLDSRKMTLGSMRLGPIREHDLVKDSTRVGTVYYRVARRVE